ncbi:hypothetical protein GCM10011351_11620 [Paraliobacillus quinghaiensis]|uniref:Aminoglycoside phosphotransferase domain-containing protein n=2 Tax=Paraliobacillus quinghaiensis TaxID=470815 RepID=A0A917WTA4_9BACI|nr:hypothetical protein GCM10011351_11620 [Paraliobacillus quinghaiensis]
MNSKSRDDSIKSRLASFLQQEGGMIIVLIKQIKYPIFKITTDSNKSFVLKGYKQFETIKKQWLFFSHIEESCIVGFNKFPNQKKYIKGFGYYWVLQPYIVANRLDYNKEVDRVAAWKTIDRFHTVINGLSISSITSKISIQEKWQKRLDKWRQSKVVLEKYNNLALYVEIEQLMLDRINYYQLLNQPKIEEKSLYRSNWIHGDVASHNFLRDNSNNIYMIDFDLVAQAPSLYDYMQLGQRFIPYIEYDLDRLCTYIDRCSLEDWRLLLIGISIPTDLIREWWYYMMHPRTDKQVRAYIQEFSEAWELRKKFVADVDAMIKFS